MQLKHEIKATNEQLARAQAKLAEASQRKEQLRTEARTLADELAHAQAATQAAQQSALASLQAEVHTLRRQLQPAMHCLLGTCLCADGLDANMIA